MPHLLHVLWLFGALSFGIVVGWLTYLLAATRWDGRPIHVAIGAVAIGVLLAIAKVVPPRYGYRLELGVVLAVVGAVGCFVGWALRDLAEFMPAATRPEATASAAATGSYLFRDALAGMGAGPAYMRATTGHGGPARMRMAPSADAPTPAPALGGYTFPKTLPFADATTLRRSEPPNGMRRHWTWPASAQSATAADIPAPASDATAAGVASSQTDRAEHNRQPEP